MCAINVCDETARQTDVCPLLYVPLSLYIYLVYFAGMNDEIKSLF